MYVPLYILHSYTTMSSLQLYKVYFKPTPQYVYTTMSSLQLYKGSIKPTPQCVYFMSIPQWLPHHNQDNFTTIPICLSYSNTTIDFISIQQYLAYRTRTKLYFNSHHVNGIIYKHSVLAVGYLGKYHRQIVICIRCPPP